jgi:hypothetical protein
VSRNQDGSATISIYRDHPFARKATGSSRLKDFMVAEVHTLSVALRHGPIYIDGPIDLQGFHNVFQVTFKLDVGSPAVPAQAGNTLTAQFPSE